MEENFKKLRDKFTFYRKEISFYRYIASYITLRCLPQHPALFEIFNLTFSKAR